MSTIDNDLTTIIAEGVQSVPTAHVWVLDGFNPRTDRDADTFEQTTKSVAATGVLQPILVTPQKPEGADENDPRILRVVAGEGRYLAAVAAAQDALPVTVRHADPATGGLEWAIEENIVREAMDVVAIAKAWKRLKDDARWGVKKIAGRFNVSQKLVTERLRILDLPEVLHPQIADGTIPLSAIRPLAELAKAHADLPTVLVARVDAFGEAQGIGTAGAWSKALRDPANLLNMDLDADGCALPDGVYATHYGSRISVDALDLSDEASAALAVLSEWRDYPITTLSFDRDGIDQAAAMGCVYRPAGDQGHAVLIGRDVASQLLGDAAIRSVERERKWRRPANGDAETEAMTPEERDAAEKEARRDKRTQAEQDKATAIAYNEQLGAEVARHLARVDPTDVKVIQLLSAVDFTRDIAMMAARGARYTLPGWVGSEPRKNGEAKRVYLTTNEAGDRARAWLAAVTDPAEVAGRLISLIALAHYADERAVAQSSRIYWHMTPTATPWGTEPVDLLHAVCGAVLPATVTAVRHAERAERQAAIEAERKEKEDAAVRLADYVERAADLTPEEREQALKDAQAVHGYQPEGHEIRRVLRAAAPAGEQAEDAGDDLDDDLYTDAEVMAEAA